MSVTGGRTVGRAVVLLLGTIACSGTAFASPADPPATPSLADVRQQIASAESRHRGAKGRVIAGGIVIGIGFIATVVSSANDEENQYADENEEVKINWGPLLIGAAIGAPLLATGITDMASSRRDIRHLRQREQGLSFVPLPGGAGVSFNVAF